MGRKGIDIILQGCAEQLRIQVMQISNWISELFPTDYEVN